MALVGGATVWWPLAAYAQPRVSRLGVLLFGSALLPNELRITRELARIGSLNHVPGDAINPQRPIEVDANTLILLPLWGTADMAGPTAGLVRIDNDPTTSFEAGDIGARREYNL